MVDTTSPAPDSGRKLFFGLFIFPLLIVIGMAALMCTVVLMTHETETPETLIVSLKKSPPSKRWQKAFELSNELNRNAKNPPSETVSREMLAVLRDANNFDPKTRSYMALALSHSPSKDAYSALKDALADPEEEVRVHAIWSLGLSGKTEAAPLIEKELGHDSPEVRKAAAYVLGALRATTAVPALQRALTDQVPDVRWNAALALARLGNTDGYDILLSMLERERLSREMNLDEAQIESVMVNAMRGLALIPKADSIKILQTISKGDRNLRVRQASLDSLKQMENIHS